MLIIAVMVVPCLPVLADSSAMTLGAGTQLSLGISRGELQQQEKQERADDSRIT